LLQDIALLTDLLHFPTFFNPVSSSRIICEHFNSVLQVLQILLKPADVRQRGPSRPRLFVRSPKSPGVSNAVLVAQYVKLGYVGIPSSPLTSMAWSPHGLPKVCEIQKVNVEAHKLNHIRRN
jgi:hypothetical protein